MLDVHCEKVFGSNQEMKAASTILNAALKHLNVLRRVQRLKQRGRWQTDRHDRDIWDVGRAESRKEY